MHSTFDIFDTVLTRPLACPQDAFWLLADRLREEGLVIPPDRLFFQLRLRSERWARRLSRHGEVNLREIYDVIGALLFWSDPMRERAVQCERKLEAELLIKAPHGVKQLEFEREQGRLIGFVSDMYLDSAFLRSILIREGLYANDDRLVVSCEDQTSKAKETIWLSIAKAWKLDLASLRHYGDNPHADVQSPSKSGILANRLGTSEMSRWESWNQGETPLSLTEWGKIATLSRLARAQEKSPDSYVVQFGSCVLGPMVLGFASWVLTQAKNAGIKTLWFLSRDAKWFFDAAQKLPEADCFDLRYVAINRNLLTLAVKGARQPSEWFSHSRRVTWFLLQQRWFFNDGDMLLLSEEMGLSAYRADEIIDEPAQFKLLQVMMLPHWKALLNQRASEAASSVKDYLQQTVADSERVAIVDVGWHGRSQEMIQALCPSVIKGYYLGLSNQIIQPEKEAWLFDVGRGEGALDLNFFQRMIEVFLGGVCGPLQGYECVGGKWEPVFSSKLDKEHTPGLSRMHCSAATMVEMSLRREYLAWWSSERLRAFTECQLRRLLINPRTEDARFYSQWLVTTDDGHQDLVSPALGFDRRRFMNGLRGKEPWAMIWPSASLRNSRFLWRSLLRLGMVLQRFKACLR